MLDFTVIIPYYDAKTTIERTLDSLLLQTYKNFEIIIVNDKSPDDPSSIFDLYEKKFLDMEIELIYLKLNDNSGSIFVRNFAWNKTKGTYVVFLDSDDFWHPQKLQFNFIAITETDPGIVFHDCGVLRTGFLNEISETHYSKDLLKFVKISKYKWFVKNLVVTPSVLIGKNLNFRFDTNIKYCEDYDLLLRIAHSDKKVVKMIISPLCFLGKPSMNGDVLSSNMLKTIISEYDNYYQTN
jgi:teichuronic acid biosynthesis glycosyltransferase TuaG